MKNNSDIDSMIKGLEQSTGTISALAGLQTVGECREAVAVLGKRLESLIRDRRNHVLATVKVGDTVELAGTIVPLHLPIGTAYVFQPSSPIGNIDGGDDPKETAVYHVFYVGTETVGVHESGHGVKVPAGFVTKINGVELV